MRFVSTLVFCLATLSSYVVAQTQADAAQLQVPRLIQFSGNVQPGSSSSQVVGVTFALYREQSGGSPLWLETKNVAIDAQGHYSVLLGSDTKDGVPADLFTTKEARWLGVKPDGQDEQPRVLLVSVPYALKAGDAETLGGRPLSAFVLQQAPPASNTSAGDGITLAARTTSPSLGIVSLDATASNGTPNTLAKYDGTGANLVSSAVTELNGLVGIGTASPQAALDVQSTSATGQNALNSTVGLSNSSTLNGQITSAMNLNFNDLSTANNLSKQTLRIAYIRSANATGGVSAFDTVFTASPFINGNAPYQLRGMSVEGPSMASGKTLDTFIGAYIGAPSGAGTVTNKFALLTAPGAGNVGINNVSPGNALTVGGVVESTSGGFKFPDGSTLASATSQGTSMFTGNTINQVLAVTQQGTGVAANFTASNGTQTISAVQNGAGVSQFNPSGIPSAVLGTSTTNTGNAAGVFGSSSSYLGYGVTGVNLSTCDPNDLTHCNAMGVFGISAAATRGTGVWGEAETTTGDNVGVFGKTVSNSGTGVYGYANATSGDSTGVFGYSTAPTGSGIFGQVDSGSGTPAAVYGLVTAGAGVGAQFDVQTSGNILVGRSGTGSTFSKVFRVDSTGKGYFNNGTQTGGADFAESVAVNGGASLYQPGDVLVVDESGARRFALSNEAYSSKVAGIYSTKPGVLATPHHDGDPRLADEVPLAIVGIVPCKVSAENGPIKAGDLLVASSRPGYAMKGTDRSRMLGAVVGKALGALDKDTGVIEVLVSLH